MKHRVALIISYFGVLPDYFAYFVKSVGASPILDLLLFTDAEISDPVPENITVYRSSLSEFNERASRTLSVPVFSTNPFKTCDFRPAFGKMFAEYIRDYEFWAFGDLDLIYGDLAGFLKPLLHDFDLISCRKGWISGSLCVLRNCDKVNDLYKLSADWRAIFTSPVLRQFEELGGCFFQPILKGTDVLSIIGPIDSFTHVVKRQAKEGSLRCAFEDLACEVLPWGETVRFHSGKLTRSSDDSEVMYIHYVVMKARFFEVPKSKAVPDSFYVRRTGVYLNKPNLVTHCSIELLRILRGSFRAGRRVIRRQLKRSLATV